MLRGVDDSSGIPFQTIGPEESHGIRGGRSRQVFFDGGNRIGDRTHILLIQGNPEPASALFDVSSEPIHLGYPFQGWTVDVPFRRPFVRVGEPNDGLLSGMRSDNLQAHRQPTGPEAAGNRDGGMTG